MGPSTQESLASAGIRTFDDLLRWELDDLQKRFGNTGARLWKLARGQDARSVSISGNIKTISNETTFESDVSSADVLDGYLWRMSEKVSDRTKVQMKAGRIITLKLKTADHKIITRRKSLHQPTQMTESIYGAAKNLLDRVALGSSFRLLGVGLSGLTSSKEADLEGDLLDPDAMRRAKAERATDSIRKKFGKGSILKGRALR